MSSQTHFVLQHHTGAKTLFVASLIPLTLNSNQVLAQAEEAGSTSSISAHLEEVVVTAQKREENVQDVPATINAISARALDDFSILDFEDVQSLAPGVGLQPVDARSQVIVIRGVASDPDNVATAPITPYVNDIPVVDRLFSARSMIWSAWRFCGVHRAHCRDAQIPPGPS
jgi:outer membrane receptor protein involved in Fe transport